MSITKDITQHFKKCETFTLKDAVDIIIDIRDGNIKAPSIRARIYESIKAGLFQRIDRGIFAVTRYDEESDTNTTSILLQGNSQNLTSLGNNSIDAVITDHPCNLKKSLKGGSRNFTQYNSFLYRQTDFNEKFRVLKTNIFL